MTDREAVFLEKLARTGLWQLPDLLQTLPDETARLARLCYAASPAGDWLDTPPEVFFSCAAHARFLRENAAWTRALPEPLISAVRAGLDTPAALDDWYIGMSIEPCDDPETMLQKLPALTVEDVVRAARRITTDTIYFLKGDEA